MVVNQSGVRLEPNWENDISAYSQQRIIGL